MNETHTIIRGLTGNWKPIIGTVMSRNAKDLYRWKFILKDATYKGGNFFNIGILEE